MAIGASNSEEARAGSPAWAGRRRDWAGRSKQCTKPSARGLSAASFTSPQSPPLPHSSLRAPVAWTRTRCGGNSGGIHPKAIPAPPDFPRLPLFAPPNPPPAAGLLLRRLLLLVDAAHLNVKRPSTLTAKASGEEEGGGGQKTGQQVHREHRHRRHN